MNGPFACGDYPDIKIFRIALKHDLDEGERVEADAGYVGEASIKAPGPLYTDKEYVGMRRRAAQRHETVNGRLKIFNCLNEKFRHGVAKHAICFRAIAVLTQLAIENNEPLFPVDYNDNY